MKKFFAFTLAEVLITLGIIGVVAALTIPTLISNHQKKVYVTQLKKSVNTLTNGFKLMLADAGVDSLENTNLITTGGTPPYTYNTLNGEELKKYFNIVEQEDDYSLYSWVYKSISGSDVYGHQLGGSFTSCTLITTTDGAQICMAGASGTYSGKTLAVAAVIDVNSYHRLPNTPGKDVFYANFDSNGMLVVTTPSAHASSVNSSCISNGSSCLDSVVMNNWEITYY